MGHAKSQPFCYSDVPERAINSYQASARAAKARAALLIFCDVRLSCRPAFNRLSPLVGSRRTRKEPTWAGGARAPDDCCEIPIAPGTGSEFEGLFWPAMIRRGAAGQRPVWPSFVRYGQDVGHPRIADGSLVLSAIIEQKHSRLPRVGCFVFRSDRCGKHSRPRGC